MTQGELVVLSALLRSDIAPGGRGKPAFLIADDEHRQAALSLHALGLVTLVAREGVLYAIQPRHLSGFMAAGLVLDTGRPH